MLTRGWKNEQFHHEEDFFSKPDVDEFRALFSSLESDKDSMPSNVCRDGCDSDESVLS